MEGNETSDKAASSHSGRIPSYVLDDLSSRFIINSSQEDMKSAIRILFQIEVAYWFYLDFHRVENPSLKECSMKEFSFSLMSHCSPLQHYISNFHAHFESWKNYKRTIATYGAIILDQELKHVLLVQSFSGRNSWGFPKGKINYNEAPVKCAAREVFEETGFDIMPYVDPLEFLEKSANDQVTRLYLIAGVPLNTEFQPKTRREIRDIQWFPLDTLPTHKGDQTLKEAIGQNYNLYMVTPYLRAVRKWITIQLENSAKSRTRHRSGKQQDMGQTKKGKATSTKISHKGQSVRYSKDMALADRSAKQGRRGMTVLQSLFGNKDGQNSNPAMEVKFKAPVVDTNSFYSKTWYNFELNVDDMMKLLPLEGGQSNQASFSH